MNIVLALAIGSLFLFYAVLFVVIINDIVRAAKSEEDKQFMKLCLDALTVAVGLVAMGARV